MWQVRYRSNPHSPERTLNRIKYVKVTVYGFGNQSRVLSLDRLSGKSRNLKNDGVSELISLIDDSVLSIKE